MKKDLKRPCWMQVLMKFRDLTFKDTKGLESYLSQFRKREALP